MNESKLHRAEQALSGIEKKVFDAVPYEEAWDRHAIVGEMRRATGSNPDPHVVDGCIVDLIQRNLVQEPTRGMFKRVAPKVRVMVKPALGNGGTAPLPVPAAPIGPPLPTIDVLANLSKKLRLLADEFDAAAIQVAADLERQGQEADRFRQLQTLLKQVSG